MKSSKTKVVIGIIIAIVAIGLLKFKPWKTDGNSVVQKDEIHDGPNNEAKRSLTVGYLPVTCHITCPVTDFASKTTSSNTNFNSQRFGDFPTIVAALNAKTIQASFLNLPLAMKMREDGSPVKVCYLGHRDGSEIIIAKNNPAKTLRDLKGKTIAFPSTYSNQQIVFKKVMLEQGMKFDDINMVIVPPPDMPTALASGSIDGYFVAEPICARSEMDGFGRVLYMTKDIWPNFISCVLVVHEDLIKENPEVVRDLVRGIAESGKWVEHHRAETAELVAPYYRQSKELMDYVLVSDTLRVRYVNLTPYAAEIQKIHDMGVEMGLLKKKMNMEELVDNSFVPDPIPDLPLDIHKQITQQ